jgi:hypothetical protein
MKECVFEKLVVPQLLMMDGGKITKWKLENAEYFNTLKTEICLIYIQIFNFYFTENIPL